MATLEVKVIPNSRKNGIEAYGNGIKVKLNAPAVDGKANKALLAYLAETFGFRKNKLSIIRGELSRNKVVEIPGTELPEVIRELLN